MSIIDLLFQNYTGEIVFNDKSDIVIPVSYSMKGYDFVNHVLRFYYYCRNAGIATEGEVVITGEESDDNTRVIIKDGIIKWQRARLVYDKDMNFMESDIINFSKEERDYVNVTAKKS